jgi:fatty-acyl-CoA synthase
MATAPASTIADLLLARADDAATALRELDRRTTWAETVAGAARRARLFRALVPDAAPPHIGVLLPNTIEFIEWLAAAALSRSTLVGINPTRRGDELARDIRHTDCRLIVTDAAGAELIAGLDLGIDANRILRVDDDDYAAALAAHDDDPVLGVTAEAGDRLLLLFTSGSTGAPKAVICSQGRLAGTANTTVGMFGITERSVCYLCMPLFHGNSIMTNFAPALRAGATIGLRPRFSASAFLDDVRRYGATYFNYVGRALAYVLATPERPDDADNSLQLGFGTEASAQDMERFSARFGCRLLENYGSSEGGLSIVRDDTTPPNALGVPRSGSEAQIIDPETGTECPRAIFGPNGELINASDAIGEIVAIGAARSFEGYYNNPEAESSRVRNGNYWTGDLGYRDADGWFYFAGRGGDWLRVDSENFAAAPIERILHRYAPVVMCAVFPVPDARTGDQVMAVLEIPGGRFDPDDFAAFLAAQGDLGTKWAPRFVRVITTMPLTASNKVDKNPLRRERWDTTDALFVRDGTELRYRPFTLADRSAMLADFERNGRANVLTY